MKVLLSLLRGCPHTNLSRVFGAAEQHYVVCFDCGAEFEYDWQNMRQGERIGVGP